MNKSVAHYISELLFLHDCVIIPNFGGFVGNPQSAQLNKTTGTLTPTSKQILFNTNLKKNDGLLIAHIAHKEGITQNIAKQNVEIFSNESTAKLSNSKILRLEKIGLFTVGKEENIIFLQDHTTNYSLDAFGMSPTYNKSITRKTETEKQVDATIQTIRAKRKNSKPLLRAAAVIIPLIALSYLSVSQQEKINTVYSQIATLNPFTLTKIAEEIIEPAEEKKITIAINPTPKTKVIEENLATAIIPKEKYHIIVGSFTVQDNANKMLNKIKISSYNSKIIEGGRFLRVSYNSFHTKEEALVSLNKIRRINPQAWLLTK